MPTRPHLSKFVWWKITIIVTRDLQSKSSGRGVAQSKSENDSLPSSFTSAQPPGATLKLTGVKSGH